MSHLLSEPRIALSALARREGVHISTAWRWHLRGIRGHRLETYHVGARIYTTLPAYERWLARINGEPLPAGQTPRRREAAIRRAERELDKLGI